MCRTCVAWPRGAREKISPHPSLSKRGIWCIWMDVISGAHPGMCPSFLTPHSAKVATDPFFSDAFVAPSISFSPLGRGKGEGEYPVRRNKANRDCKSC